jgi:hypothetical protein
MTGLIAGYATSLVAMLAAASAALTIIYTIGGLDSIDVAPPREEPVRKVAA